LFGSSGTGNEFGVPELIKLCADVEADQRAEQVIDQVLIIEESAS
jgi:hypothetical protein